MTILQQDNRNANGIASEESASPTAAAIASNNPSYPTRSLQFLHPRKRRGTEHGSCNGDAHGDVCLSVVVAGAGLGGLATAVALARRGHKVTVLEQANQLAEVGAGIQIPSNSTRLLLQWGLGPFLGENVVEPESISFRRWEDGSVIGYTKLVPDFRENFGAPYYVVHRAHFHDALYRLALHLGVEVQLGCKAADYDVDAPSLTLADGTSFSGDLIIAADGEKSVARRRVLGGADRPPSKTGFAAYRATVDVEKMKQDPEISWLLEKPGLNLWIGDMRHVMTYTIAAGKSFNMVLSHPDNSDPGSWNQETALEDMRRQFKHWDRRLTKIIDMVDKTLKWPLLSGHPLDRWVAPSGRFLFLGDAAHAMVPYMSQGAAMAVEDAAALAEALSKIDSKDQLQPALRLFESVRIKRTTQMQEASLLNGKLWHFADGPEQKARDAAMRPEVEGRHFIESPNQWSDPVTQCWCYGYDAEEAISDAWDAEFGAEYKTRNGQIHL